MLSSEDTVTSSPQPKEAAVFSDQATRASSPPSSPPGFPWDLESDAPKASAPVQVTTQSAFSVLGKRKALSPVSDNARPAKKTASSTGKNDANVFTQMQISIGQEIQKRCKECGMEYVASSVEDRKLHDKYHKQHAEGYDVGKDFATKAPPNRVLKPKHHATDSICVVNCFDKPARKRRAQAALEIVQRELGAVAIAERDLWDMKAAANILAMEANYQAYMYVRGSKCVGFLLTQKIADAHQVLEPKPERETAAGPAISKGSAASLLKARKEALEAAAQQAASQPMQLSTEAYPAALGICRIWTSPQHRNQNIATSLLDAAIQHHNQRAKRSEKAVAERSTRPGYAALPAETREVLDKELAPAQRLEKGDVAFSQPTEAGAQLARKWFGMLFGWKVYVD